MSEKDWFKPGDKVRVVDDGGYSKLKNGDILTVVKQNRYDNVVVLGDGEDTAQAGFYPWRFELVDSLASTIAAVKSGDRVTVRTKYATYAEFEVQASRYGSIVSVGEEVAINKSDIIELTITKPALPAEPGVGAIVKFTETHHNSAYQIRDEKGWVPIRNNGFVSTTHFTWERTLLDVGHEFEVIREGKK